MEKKGKKRKRGIYILTRIKGKAEQEGGKTNNSVLGDGTNKHTKKVVSDVSGYLLFRVPVNNKALS